MAAYSYDQQMYPRQGGAGGAPFQEEQGGPQMVNWQAAQQQEQGYGQEPQYEYEQHRAQQQQQHGLGHDRGATVDSGYYGPGPAAAGAAQPPYPPPKQQFGESGVTQAKHNAHHANNDADYGPYASTDIVQGKSRKLSKKWQRRLYWIVPLCLLGIAIVILFEVYKDDFLRWARPMTDWLTARQDWSWIIPVAILFLLSFPPLFGAEVVHLIIGLVYPIGVAIGIACGGAILGEAGCFMLFKYGFTNYVRRKCEKDLKWATVARVAEKEGFVGVLIVRYSILPPHLVNPLFASTGMAFWLYMITVIISLPKQIVFVVLGTQSNAGKTGAKVGKVIAFGVLALVTLAGSWYIKKKMAIARAEIEAERAAGQGKPGIAQAQNGVPMSEMENGHSQDPLVQNGGAGGEAQYSNGYGGGNGNGYNSGSFGPAHANGPYPSYPARQ